VTIDAFLGALPDQGVAPKSFCRFVLDLGVSLTPAQDTLCRVAFDGEPARTPLARELFAIDAEVPGQIRGIVVAVCGARAGKSYVLGGLRLLHLALTVPLTTLAPGETASALIVAPDVRLGRQVLRYALGAAEKSPDIKRRITQRTADGFTLKRRGGSVRIEVLPATRGGAAVRGRSLVGAVLDECAYFRDSSYKVNDQEIYRAIAPRILQGGQLVLVSTPWAEQGLLWDFYKRNFGHPVDALVSHAPTLLLRDDEHTRAYVERERANDPVNASQEFDAEFMSTAGEAFFDAASITGAIEENPEPAPGSVASIGADFGFRSDSSALIAAYREPVPAQRIVVPVDAIVERVPEKRVPLKPSIVVKEFAAHVRAHRADSIVADGHYRQAIAEHLEEAGLSLVSAPEGANGKAETYQVVRALLREGRIRIPDHERFIRQLREVTARPTAGGGISIVSPRWRTGGHGDIVSAFVLAAWDASRGLVEAAPVYQSPADLRAAKWMESMREDQTRYEDEMREEAWADFRAWDDG
jgi:hypothetical protein